DALRVLAARRGSAPQARRSAPRRSLPARVGDREPACGRVRGVSAGAGRGDGAAAMNRRRVAVTGIGLMSALGITRETVWDGLVSGRCGIADVTLFDPAGYRSPKAAEIPTYARDPAFSEKPWRRLSRSDQIAVIASREALDDSGLLKTTTPRDRMGV